MSFANPTAFWGLLGLLVPIFVFLLSKRKQDLVEFGSLTFLQISETQSARTIFPSQWLPFLIRSLLLLALLFFLAKPIFKNDSTRHIIFVEEGVYQDPTFEEIKKNLKEGSSVVRFAFDKDHEKVEYMPSFQVLMGRLNQVEDSLTVYTYNHSKHFTGRPRYLREGVNWKVWPQRTALQQSLVVQGEDRAYNLEISSDETGLKWDGEVVDLSPSTPLQTIGINLLCPESRTEERDKLVAVLTSLSEVLPISIDTEAQGSVDWTISIDTVAIEYNGALLIWDMIKGKLSLDRLSHEIFYLRGGLTDDHVIGSNLPLELADILLERTLELEHLDQRVAASPSSLENGEEVVLKASAGKFKFYYLLLILLILVLERWYAFKISRS